MLVFRGETRKKTIKGKSVKGKQKKRCQALCLDALVVAVKIRMLWNMVKKQPSHSGDGISLIIDRSIVSMFMSASRIYNPGQDELGTGSIEPRQEYKSSEQVKINRLKSIGGA